MIGGFDKLPENIRWHALSSQKLGGCGMPFASTCSLNEHTGVGLEDDTAV